jgi:hypothetical protein
MVMRLLCGLSMRDAAEVLGCSSSYICKLEEPGLAKSNFRNRDEMTQRLRDLFDAMRQVVKSGARTELKEELERRVGYKINNSSLLRRLELMAIEAWLPMPERESVPVPEPESDVEFNPFGFHGRVIHE